jgi:hypothetical protein
LTDEFDPTASKGYQLTETAAAELGREPLPCIPVPLSEQESAVPLDLQVAVRQAYVEGPYRRMLDYAVPPLPPLREEDREWARSLIEAAGLPGPERG